MYDKFILNKNNVICSKFRAKFIIPSRGKELDNNLGSCKSASFAGEPDVNLINFGKKIIKKIPFYIFNKLNTLHQLIRALYLVQVERQLIKKKIKKS